MPNKARGSLHLLRVAGVDIYLHWSWFLVAMFEIRGRSGRYSSVAWNVLEYLALFSIVLLHEFGHALACRQVGGTVDRIMLWPLGGVAYVNPPQRPGATLWSIAAGPLVNVALFPLFFGAYAIARMQGWSHSMPDIYMFVRAVLAIDIGLLAFNLLPVYPLDGGQIVRSLFWYVLGRGRSLMLVTVLSFIGIAALLALAVWTRSLWSVAIAVFMLMNCWGGLQRARALLRMAKLPRRSGFTCPSCRTAPPLGAFWGCKQCAKPFDTFETHARCPHCSAQYSVTTCLDCGQSRPMDEWIADGAVVAGAAVRRSLTAQP
jgi:Zn-dependent protease